MVAFFSERQISLLIHMHLEISFALYKRTSAEQITKADRLRVSRPLQKLTKRAHESPQVTNNGKARAKLRRLSSTVRLPR